MRKAKLKEAHDKAVVADEFNDIFIETTLESLCEEDLSCEDRKDRVNTLKKELELRDHSKRVQSLYKERKAEDRGYWIGVTGCMLGLFLSEVGPKVLENLKKK